MKREFPAATTRPATEAPRVAVAILGRAPVAGEAKTRLIPRLGAAGAAALQAWMLQRAVATALVADVGPVSLWCAGDPGHPEFALCRAFGNVSLRRQGDGDLGERMLKALEDSPAPGGTLLVGTDCPALGPGLLRQAAAALGEHDAVAIPAEDGGYVLLGARRAAPELFAEVRWGSSRVMEQTRHRLRSLGWTWSEPATLWDVDHPADLDRLLAAWPEAGEALR
ncbi:MAG: TIGR04282 family arsenosugar biosynthesis glycosyltransferase [Rhodocyclales bacterium]|nr:TIGR04282 family arsenosugar biosynthesis glycosyltransferase [Rhodocyclales bacterium]